MRQTYAERIAYDYLRMFEALKEQSLVEEPIVAALLVVAMNLRRLLDAAGQLDDEEGA